MTQFITLACILLSVLGSVQACDNSTSPTTPPRVPPGAKSLNIRFKDYKRSHDLTDWLNNKGLYVSAYKVSSKPYPRTFVPENVFIKNGALNLKVNKGARGHAGVKSAEVGTLEDQITSCKITTRAKAGRSPGVCHGFFTYYDDTQESDIEILTSYITKGYGPSDALAVPPGLQLTNQDVTGNRNSTNSQWPYPWHPADAFHDYTLEWTKGVNKFYVDGKLIKTYKTNVPTVPSSFIWNSWSSGDPYWSAGPPRADNILQIESISGWYKTA